MEVTLKDISHRILQIAEERGYSKYVLADKVPEVVQSTVYNAISGEMSMKVETLLYICKALEIIYPCALVSDIRILSVCVLFFYMFIEQLFNELGTIEEFDPSL